MSDYKSTLNLPRSDFPMRASLTQNEPKMLEFWEKTGAYQAMIQAGKGNARFVLHDGPPYANGHIHLGTSTNKILKDIILKSKNLRSVQAEYVPGWDCHGLPIELKVEQELSGQKNELGIIEFRDRCRQYALGWLDTQREEFKRLGVFGAWGAPYKTMDPSYEAATARELANFMSKGSVQRSKKPIHWCCSCRTALAEAEVEYAEQSSPSIYVRFPLNDPGLSKRLPGIDPDRTFIVIWTTTPWTIPDNMAVAVHPDLEYALVEHQGEVFILASELVDINAERFGWTGHRVVEVVPGSLLEGLSATHPFYDRPSPIVLADYVSLDSGTGCVHTAPGHGREDYDTGLRYGLDILSPLDDCGAFLEEVGFFAGMTVYQANPKVIEKLEEVGNLLAKERITHSYPNCWRCKKPVIFRATTQWFISMAENDLRERTLQAINEKVSWIPSWGRERIHSMIAFRPDWCISRQRLWGVPIIALVCKGCGEAFFDAEWVFSIVERFETHPNGADYWFEASLEEVVPAGLKCAGCGSSTFEKEDDILDVWFDSGTSFAAVLEKRAECGFPADLYLEGTDQHRGWFHSSLLASMGTRGTPPYRSVLTHGFVVDGKGKKMSKSLGNVIAPQEIIDKYGAEILRIWVAAENYQEDMRISDEILKRLVDAYRRIRNTCRFLLGNLSDFDPRTDAVLFADMLPLDRYALDLTLLRHARMQKAFDEYEFHKAFHTLHNLCGTDLSAFYLDILKDRLYVSGRESRERRSAQTALWHILQALLTNMAPILSFTAEEVFQSIPRTSRDAETVFATRFEPPFGDLVTEEERGIWDLVSQVRTEVTRAIEPVRKSGEVGHSLDTRIILFAGPEILEALTTVENDLREIFIVSQVELQPLAQAPADAYSGDEIKELKVLVQKALGEKCERCWTFSKGLGTAEDLPTVCPRCTAVLIGMNT
jgi:isoleucyl-tRNA synthetase